MDKGMVVVVGILGLVAAFCIFGNGEGITENAPNIEPLLNPYGHEGFTIEVSTEGTDKPLVKETVTVTSASELFVVYDKKHHTIVSNGPVLIPWEGTPNSVLSKYLSHWDSVPDDVRGEGVYDPATHCTTYELDGDVTVGDEMYSFLFFTVVADESDHPIRGDGLIIIECDTPGNVYSNVVSIDEEYTYYRVTEDITLYDDETGLESLFYLVMADNTMSWSDYHKDRFKGGEFEESKTTQTINFPDLKKMEVVRHDFTGSYDDPNGPYAYHYASNEGGGGSYACEYKGTVYRLHEDYTIVKTDYTPFDQNDLEYLFGPNNGLGYLNTYAIHQTYDETYSFTD